MAGKEAGKEPRDKRDDGPLGLVGRIGLGIASIVIGGFKGDGTPNTASTTTSTISNTNNLSSNSPARIVPGHVVAKSKDAKRPSMATKKVTNKNTPTSTTSSVSTSSSTDSGKSVYSNSGNSVSNDRIVGIGRSESTLSNSVVNSVFKSSKMDQSRKPFRITQFEEILSGENIDLNALRKLSWNGIPPEFRTQVWQLLLGYLPTNKGRRDAAIIRKRKEYVDSIPIYFSISESDRTTQEGEVLRQIQVDLPRTCPHTPFFQQQRVQDAMERILYIWAIRHPASSYVQGMNDLLTPLYIISLYPYFNDVLRCDVQQIDPKILMDVEADAYWCLTKILDGIQDHYTFSQPGLQRMVLKLEDLMNRVNKGLNDHFRDEGIQYLQFSFRWMNCLLLREIPLKAILRVWDTCLAEEYNGFEVFHVYVCCVLLQTFKDKLIHMQFQDILMFLQELPTEEWDEVDVEPLLSQAYIYSMQYSE